MTIEQLSLDDAPRYRRTDQVTATLAAREQTPEKLAAGKWAALDALAQHGPQTDHELAALTGYLQTSIGVRRGALVRQGWAVATDERRPSPSGSTCTVWRVTDDGRRVWTELRLKQANGGS